MPTWPASGDGHELRANQFLEAIVATTIEYFDDDRALLKIEDKVNGFYMNRSKPYWTPDNYICRKVYGWGGSADGIPITEEEAAARAKELGSKL
jgi:hypothetical protein